MICRWSCLSDHLLIEQLAGQPIEQLGMRRPIAVEAKIAGRGDQPGAEVVMPEPIDGHAPHQRIGRIGQPARPGPPGARARASRPQPDRASSDLDDRQCPRRNFVARRFRITSLQQMRGRRLLRNDRIDFLVRCRVGQLRLELASLLEQGGLWPHRRRPSCPGRPRPSRPRRRPAADRRKRSDRKRCRCRRRWPPASRNRSSSASGTSSRGAARGMIDVPPFGPQRSVDIDGKVGVGAGSQVRRMPPRPEIAAPRYSGRALANRGQIERERFVGVQTRSSNGRRRRSRRRRSSAVSCARTLPAWM